MAARACKFWKEKKSGRARHLAGEGCTQKSADPSTTGHAAALKTEITPAVKGNSPDVAGASPEALFVGVLAGAAALLAGFVFWHRSRA
jgi:hypothetical protein